MSDLTSDGAAQMAPSYELPVRLPGVEGRAGKFPGPSLIPALNAIQREHGWLPRPELIELSRRTRRPLYEIQGLISFYPHFRTDPPPKVQLAVCHDLSCWLHGAEQRLEQLRAEHGQDVDVELVETSCLGRCDQAPASATNEDYGQAQRTGQRFDNDPYPTPTEHYGVLRRALTGELDSEQIITALKDSGLRGMGGAGFPTGKKWELVAAQTATPKYAICNADESEPGTFKDRQILAEQPHLILEGMLISMIVCGIEHGWVFIRHEYAPEEHIIAQEIDRLTDLGLLGDNVQNSGRTLHLEIFTSPGGYILGEETALIECMEGHRGEPRNKPPFPGIYGLWGKPTLMNSVETFADVPTIIHHGAQWWKDQGINQGTGLKFFAISGHITNPGVYCVPMGTTTRQLIDRAGGMLDNTPLGAFQPGGASSNFLGPDHLDTPLDFTPLQDAGSMLGSGAVVVLAQGTDLLAAGTNILRFFRNESCGKCVPCRTGSHKAHTILTQALTHNTDPDTLQQQITQLEETLRLTSICGLGQVALGPVTSTFGLTRGATQQRPQPRNPQQTQ